MKKFPVVLDLETKYTFRDFSDHRKLGISVLSVYDYASSRGTTFTEKELNGLFPILENASYVVGFNINSFDMKVLEPYYPGRIEHITTFDILDDVKKIIGKRLALNDLISTTLGKKKSGHGLMAIDYYNEGKWEELKRYCMDDVMATKELFDFGASNNEIYYLTEYGRAVIKVDWKKYLEDSGNSNTPLTLPF